VKGAFNLGFQLGGRCVDDSRVDMEDELTAVGQLVPVSPNQFAQAPLDPAADHRVANPPRHA
jgi:hypothetical protein